MCVTELSTRSVVPIHIPSATCLEKAMAPHSSTLFFFNFIFKLYIIVLVLPNIKMNWKIPWIEEPGRLQSMGSLRVGHD